MLKKGYDSKTIMKITGHKTDSVFLRYVKLTPEDAAILMLDQQPKQPQSGATITVDLVKDIVTGVLSAFPTNPSNEVLDRLHKIEQTLQQLVDYIKPDQIGLMITSISQYITVGVGASYNSNSLTKLLIAKGCLMTKRELADKRFEK